MQNQYSCVTCMQYVHFPPCRRVYNEPNLYSWLYKYSLGVLQKNSPTFQKNYTNNRQLCTQKKTYTTFRVACTMYSHYSFRWFTLKNLKGATRFIAQQSFRPLNGSHFFRDGSSLLLYPITTSRILLDTTYARWATER